VRVFFDPRNDCYSAESFREFNSFDLKSTTPDRMRQILAKTETNAALVPAKHALAALLAQEPGWRRVGEHGAGEGAEHQAELQQWMLFAR
jgi:hypothetical protein